MKAKTECHVICCNDGVEHVYIGPEAEAKKLLEALAKDYFTRNQEVYRASWAATGKFPANLYEYYRTLCFWHIHTVNWDYQCPECGRLYDNGPDHCPDSDCPGNAP